MKTTEKEVLELLKKVMSQCKRERKTKTKLSSKKLAANLGITENYLSAFESVRAVPSLQVFLRYLILSGFDVSALTSLEIKEKDLLRPISRIKSDLIQRIYSYNEDQVGYLFEQAKLAELFDLKIKAKDRQR